MFFFDVESTIYFKHFDKRLIFSHIFSLAICLDLIQPPGSGARAGSDLHEKTARYPIKRATHGRVAVEAFHAHEDDVMATKLR